MCLLSFPVFMLFLPCFPLPSFLFLLPPVSFSHSSTESAYPEDFPYTLIICLLSFPVFLSCFCLVFHSLLALRSFSFFLPLSFPTPSMLQDKPKMFAFLFDKYSHIYLYWRVIDKYLYWEDKKNASELDKNLRRTQSRAI